MTEHKAEGPEIKRPAPVATWTLRYQERGILKTWKIRRSGETVSFGANTLPLDVALALGQALVTAANWRDDWPTVAPEKDVPAQKPGWVNTSSVEAYGHCVLCCTQNQLRVRKAALDNPLERFGGDLDRNRIVRTVVAARRAMGLTPEGM